MKFVIFFFSIFVSSESLKNISYLKADYSFSKSADFFFENGKITKLIENNSQKIDYYILPSFCDSYITLNSENRFSIKLKLEAYLKYGFTHIHSVADGNEITNIRREIILNKLNSPVISNSYTTIIPSSKEFDANNLKNYFIVNNVLDLKNISYQNSYIEVFHRITDKNNFVFDSYILNDLRNLIEQKKLRLRIHTYSDNVSIIDSFISGNRNIVHPISSQLQNDLTLEHLTEINYTPILNVYRNFQFDSRDDEIGRKELEYLKQSLYFAKNFSTEFEESLIGNSSSSDELYEKEIEYKSYLNFIRDNPKILQRIIFGSGAGHKLSFPGISGIQELKIYKTIFPDSMFIFKTLTENSCSSISDTYKGKIEIGGEANFILTRENPFLKIETLLNIADVFYLGKSKFKK